MEIPNGSTPVDASRSAIAASRSDLGLFGNSNAAQYPGGNQKKEFSLAISISGRPGLKFLTHQVVQLFRHRLS